MKGTLLKWTNYWMGWQPRFFILEDGILSYYSSEAEVSQGCKGSVCVGACNLNVHHTDLLRLDIVIPGEHHIYVRASTPGERQQWLVALGSAKAQGISPGTRKGSSSEATFATGTGHASDMAKTKKSELRLYCDLLMQQVHSIKEAATTEKAPDVSKLDECTNLLHATCDTFIKTLDECLVLADASPPYGSSAAIAMLSSNGSNGKGALKTKTMVHQNSH